MERVDEGAGVVAAARSHRLPESAVKTSRLLSAADRALLFTVHMFVTQQETTGATEISDRERKLSKHRR